MIGICQNIIKQQRASSFSPITKSARISQKVQMVKAEEGSPKSSSLLYRYINPLCKRAFSQPSLSYGIGYRLLQ